MFVSLTTHTGFVALTLTKPNLYANPTSLLFGFNSTAPTFFQNTHKVVF